MKTKLLIVALLVAVAGYWTYAQQSGTAQPDPRVDKLLEQNEQILKNQAEILANQAEMKKSLENISNGVQSLRRRSS